MLQVELDIFSGRPNPGWMLSDAEEKTLVDRVMAEKSIVLPPSAAESRLGYRGFTITAVSEDNGAWQKSGLPSKFRIGGIPGPDPDAALWVLETSEKADAEVDDFLRGIVHEKILEDDARGDGGVPHKGYGMSCYDNYLTSSTNFSFWNNSPYVYQNNCYNYASNYRSNTFAQPGRKAGNTITSSHFNCWGAPGHCRDDGWADSCRTVDNISICLVIWPGTDFHFYRLCTLSRWCHKPGSTPATNKDNSGNYIYSVENCDRGPYSDFCEYFYATASVAVQ